ncbi:hypothetical protein PG993_012638 [Apiospora rasikravindrae]|uniref:C2H2-type domain-containing protein n=1 Tax=Apiospora rasikravindrae TaxID=990691 RepID=A0ABR1S311_9PEZI
MSDQAENKSQSLLAEAVNKLDLPTLQSVFMDMCAASEDFRQQATERLLVTGSAVKRPAEDSDPHGDSGPNKKQKLDEDQDTALSRYEPCQNCKKVFDVTQNTKKSCRYHDGELNIDEEVFPDDDDVQYRPDSIDVETDWRREEWPEGFIWDCCDQDCNNKGCIVERHVAAKPPQKLPSINKRSVMEIIEIESDDDEEEDESK